MQGHGQGRRSVGVVDDDGEVLPGVDALHPAGHALQSGQPAHRGVEADPAAARGGDCRQRIGGIETPGQPQ